jgi:predicted neuraminidase
LISTDDGANWTNYGHLVHPLGATFTFTEPTIVQLADNSLLMYIRSGSGGLYKSTSTDRGHTWTDPVDAGIDNSNSPAHMIKHSNGNFLLIYDADATNRYPLVIDKSTDEGTSWTRWNYVSMNALEASYPQLYEADGGIYAVYNKQDPAGLLVLRKTIFGYIIFLYKWKQRWE